MVIMNRIICVVIGYLIGTINPAYMIGKSRGMDIRTQGSGNAGASNAVIVMGKGTGVFCAILDIFKAYMVYKIAQRLFPAIKIAGLIASCACIIGHIFPIWMHFKGGKGLACLAGMVMAYDMETFFVLLFMEIIFALVVDYICAVAITGSVVFPVVYMMEGGEVTGVWILLLVAVLIIYRHLENIERIMQGKELHLKQLL